VLSNEPKIIIVRCLLSTPKMVSKTQNGRFSLKSHFAWRKSAAKFLCVKTVSGKVVRHSLACKNDWWGRHLVPELLDQTGRIGAKSPIFTALHEMQTRSSDENSVRPSVHLSVCQTRDLWQNGRKIGPDFYTIRKNI